VGYGDLRVKTERTIALKALADRVTSDADASLAQAFAEVSYAMTVSGLQVEPMASLTAYRLKTDGFVESGGASALTAQGVDHDLSASTLGVRAGESFGRGDALDARLSVAWRHTLQDMDPTAQVAFKSGGQGFAAAGTPIDEDSFVIDAGLDWKISDKLSAGAAYQGAIGKRAEDHALKAKLSYSF
jgi:subtilase-type serine protease